MLVFNGIAFIIILIYVDVIIGPVFIFGIPCINNNWVVFLFGFVPDKLIFIKPTSDGLTSLLIDQAEGDAYFGGHYIDGVYSLRITRHIQQMLLGTETSNELYLLVNAASLKARRLILNGTDATEGSIKLKLTYTRINN